MGKEDTTPLPVPVGGNLGGKTLGRPAEKQRPQVESGPG